MVGAIGHAKLLVAAALIVLFAVGGSFDAWLMVGAVAVLLAGLCSFEAFAA